MMRSTCTTCLFGQNCAERCPCEHYTPMGNDIYPDEWIDQYIEERRSEYRAAWIEYIAEE